MPVTGLKNTNRGARGNSLLMLSLMRLSNRKPPLLSESESGGSMSQDSAYWYAELIRTNGESL